MWEWGLLALGWIRSSLFGDEREIVMHTVWRQGRIKNCCSVLFPLAKTLILFHATSETKDLSGMIGWVGCFQRLSNRWTARPTNSPFSSSHTDLVFAYCVEVLREILSCPGQWKQLHGRCQVRHGSFLMSQEGHISFLHCRSKKLLHIKYLLGEGRLRSATTVDSKNEDGSSTSHLKNILGKVEAEKHLRGKCLPVVFLWCDI